MKKIFLLVLLLSLALPACKKRNNVILKSGTVVESTGVPNSGKILSEDADEFSLEDDAGFNVFEDEGKKQVESKAQADEELKWEDVDNQDERDFETIQFDYDSTSIRPSESGKIRKNVKTIKEKLSKNPTAKVRIKGHSCKIAKCKDHNYVVSQERAATLKNEYAAKGVPSDKIIAVGYGDSMLVTEDDGMNAQSINRRAETATGG